MADKCANPKCEKELVHVNGRKKKKYCSAACKTIHWQALNPLPKKRVKKIIAIPCEDGVWKLEDGKSVKFVYEERKAPINKVTDRPRDNEIPRLKGENSIDYQLRCIEINEKKNKA